MPNIQVDKNILNNTNQSKDQVITYP